MKPTEHREQSLRAYDDQSLMAAYKIAAGLPMDAIVSGKTRDQMIAFILKSEQAKRK
ncbi:MAG TPA: hypothetical protein VGG64_06755 [Pirellulales bacterium]|jgi:hypothetical protein